MSVDASLISACLVTRGNVDMQPIIDTLPYGEVIVWDNSKEELDLKVFGRYEAAKRASNKIIYWQDDDVIFTEHEALMASYRPGTFVSNNAHGPNTGGYDDLALQAAGALCPVGLIEDTWNSFFDSLDLIGGYSRDHFYKLVRDMALDRIDMPFEDSTYGWLTFGILYEADFIFGALCEQWEQIDLHYERLYADDNSRLCRQPWQEDMKLRMTNMARKIRDAV